LPGEAERKVDEGGDTDSDALDTQSAIRSLDDSKVKIKVY